jgi:hypothetical protein
LTEEKKKKKRRQDIYLFRQESKAVPPRKPPRRGGGWEKKGKLYREFILNKILYALLWGGRELLKKPYSPAAKHHKHYSKSSGREQQLNKE